MEMTSGVALYAAVVSTVALLWNIIRDVRSVRRSVRVLLTFDGAVQIGDHVVDAHMHVRATNTSLTRDVEIVSIKFQGGGLRWQTPDMVGGIRPATADEDSLPVLLTPAKSVHIPLYLSSANFGRFENTRSISVEDSVGRQHWVSRRALKSMQNRIRRLAEKARTGEPYSIRIRLGDD